MLPSCPLVQRTGQRFVPCRSPTSCAGSPQPTATSLRRLSAPGARDSPAQTTPHGPLRPQAFNCSTSSPWQARKRSTLLNPPLIILPLSARQLKRPTEPQSAVLGKKESARVDLDGGVTMTNHKMNEK